MARFIAVTDKDTDKLMLINVDYIVGIKDEVKCETSRILIHKRADVMTDHTIDDLLLLIKSAVGPI